MHSRPFAIAATDQKLLLTIVTLHLAADVQVEVPRIGQVLVRHAADRRPLVLTPLHWGVLKQFEGGRTTASVLKQMIHGRSCVPLADFYEVIVKAHRHGLLTEGPAPAATPPRACRWKVALNGLAVRRTALGCLAVLALTLIFSPVTAPAHWYYWIFGWLGTALATSAGFALAASVLRGADFEVRSPRFIRRSVLPRFEIDISDAEIAPPEVAINAALAQLIPPVAFPTLAAWFAPNLALPLVAGLLVALTPLGSGPLLKLLRSLHHEPRLSVAHDFQFEPNHTLARRVRSWLAPEELRFAGLRIAYAMVWALLVGLTACVAIGIDTLSLLHDFIALDLPGRLSIAAISLLVLGLLTLAGLGVLCIAEPLRQRWRKWHDAGSEASDVAEAPPPTPDVAQIFEFLGKTHPFELMAEHDRRNLAAALIPRICVAGELLIPEGDRRGRFHLLYSGRAAVVKSGALKTIISEVHPGGIFAENALLRSEAEPHDIRAAARSIVLELDLEVFTRLVTPFIPTHVLEDSASKVSFLRQIPLSRDWPQALMASFARRSVIQTFDRRTRVLDAGCENTLFFLVLDGELRAIKDGQVVSKLKRGDIFGEISLLQNSITQAEIVGQEPGRFLCISKPDFLAFLTQNTSIALQIEGIASRRLGHPVFSPPRNPLRHSRR